MYKLAPILFLKYLFSCVYEKQYFVLFFVYSKKYTRPHMMWPVLVADNDIQNAV